MISLSSFFFLPASCNFFVQQSAPFGLTNLLQLIGAPSQSAVINNNSEWKNNVIFMNFSVLHSDLLAILDYISTSSLTNSGSSSSFNSVIVFNSLLNALQNILEYLNNTQTTT